MSLQKVADRQGIELTRLDRFIGWLDPKRGAKRILARRMMQFAYRTPVNSRLSRYSRGRVGEEDEAQSQDIRARARDLVDNTSLADGVVDRLVQRIVGTELRMVAKTRSKSWNKKHSALWETWSQNECDVRRLTDFGGLQSAICRAQITDGRLGCILLKGGDLQLIYSDRIKTPPDKLSDDNIVDGVEMSPLGRPVRFWIELNPFAPNRAESYRAIPARNFVYFPLLKEHWRTGGDSLFRSSFDQFERVDGLLESVTTAAEIAAMFSVLIRSDEDSTIHAQATSGYDSTGNSAKHLDLEPGTAQWIGANEEITQVKPEHPGQNLREFMRDVIRVGTLPLGVPLEALLMDYATINYSGARSMLLAFDEIVAFYRARYLYPGLRRIYQWRTSKFIKQGLLDDRDDAWAHRVIPPRRRWVDPEKESTSDAIAMDIHAKSLHEIAAERGMTRDELLDERKADMEELEKRDLPVMHSTRTRNAEEDLELQEAAVRDG